MSQSLEQPSFKNKKDWKVLKNSLSVDAEMGEVIILQHEGPACQSLRTAPNNFFISPTVKTIGELESEIEAVSGDLSSFCNQPEYFGEAGLDDEETEASVTQRFIADSEEIKRN